MSKDTELAKILEYIDYALYSDNKTLKKELERFCMIAELAMDRKEYDEFSYGPLYSLFVHMQEIKDTNAKLLDFFDDKLRHDSSTGC